MSFSHPTSADRQSWPAPDWSIPEALLPDPQGAAEAEQRDTEARFTAAAAARFRAQAWVLPYWLHRQSRGADPGWSPAGPTLRNQAYRTWHTLSTRETGAVAAVDPRGLIMPAAAAPSVDVWWRTDDDTWTFPSQLSSDLVSQTFSPCGTSVTTHTRTSAVHMHAHSVLTEVDGHAVVLCELTISPQTATSTALQVAVALRPYNALGAVPVRNLTYNTKGFWTADGRVALWLGSSPPDGLHVSDGSVGDVVSRLAGSRPPEGGLTDDDLRRRSANVSCNIGLASAAACWYVSASHEAPAHLWFVVPVGNIAPRDFPYALLHDRWRKDVVAANALAPSKSPALRCAIHAANTPVPRRGVWTAERLDAAQLLLLVRALLQHEEIVSAQRLIRIIGDQSWQNGAIAFPPGSMRANAQWILAVAAVERSIPGTLARHQRELRKAFLFLERRRTERAARSDKADGLLPPGRVLLGPPDSTSRFADTILALAACRVLQTQAAAHDDLGHEHRAYVRIGDDMEARLQDHFARALEHSQDGLLPPGPRQSFSAESLDVVEALAELPEGSALREHPSVMKTLDQLINLAEAGDLGLLPDADGAADPAATLRLALLCADSNRADAAKSLANAAASVAHRPGLWSTRLHPRTAEGCSGDAEDPIAAAAWLLLHKAGPAAWQS